MKSKLLIAISLILMPVTTTARADILDQSLIVSKAIKHLHPKLNGDFLNLVTLAIIQSSKEHELDWRVLVSIISQ